MCMGAYTLFPHFTAAFLFIGCGRSHSPSIWQVHGQNEFNTWMACFKHGRFALLTDRRCTLCVDGDGGMGVKPGRK